MQDTRSDESQNSTAEDIHTAPTEVDLPASETTTETDISDKEETSPEPSTPLPYRRRDGLPRPVSILIITLIILLILSGTALILIAETTQYRTVLHEATVTEQQAQQNTQQTSQAQQTGTAWTYSTAQADIESSATAQGQAQDLATAQVEQATATAQASSDFFVTSTNTTPIFEDALADNEGDGRWDQGSSGPNTGCQFESNSYHARVADRGRLQPCIAQAERFSSFAYQVYLTINRGVQGEAGLIFRASNDNRSYYFFSINAQGSYTLTHYNARRGQTLTQGSSSAIIQGLNETNQLTVITNSNRISLYVNGQYLAEVVDNQLSTGKIGVAVANGSIDAAYRDAQVWSLSSDSSSNYWPTPTPTPTVTATPTATVGSN